MINYRYEYHPNEECASLHLSVKVADKWISDTFEVPQDVRLLFGLMSSADGVVSCTMDKYSVTVHCGMAFTRHSVLGGLLEVAKMYWPEETFDQLPDLRSDIEYKKCADCQLEQDRAMKELYEQ